MNTLDDGSTQTQVMFSMQVRFIFQVDNVAQKFSAFLDIILKWEAPQSEPEISHPTPHDWEPSWRPKYRIMNLLEELRKTTEYSTVSEGGKQYIVQEIRALVSIFEAFELEKFPFDSQQLHFKVQLLEDSKFVKFIPFNDGLPITDIMADRIYTPEFKLVTHKDQDIFSRIYETDRSKSRRKLGFSGVEAIVLLRRNAHFYMSNVMVLLLLLVGFNFLSWSIAVEEVADRLSIDFTMVLTAVAFKLVLTSYLPSVPYETYLDVYIQGSFAILGTIAFCHGVLPSVISDDNYLVKVDRGVFYTLVGCYTILNVVYYVYTKVRSDEMAKDELEQVLFLTNDSITGTTEGDKDHEEKLFC